MSSTPSLSEFDPRHIPYQYKVIKDIRENFDYSDGKHELLLSGSVGSAKSILMAHLAVTHCLLYPKARLCLGRKSLPDLKDTIFTKILEHLDDENLEEGRDFWVNHTSAKIRFRNGSEIISRSWHDKKFKKFRSIELSALVIEELTENDGDYKQFYQEAAARVGRLPDIPETFIICATNPDAPSHWVYEYFIKDKNPDKHVYYSVTTDNPFLPKWYKDQLLEMYDPKMARRMIYGEWLSITQDVIYHQYDSAIHFLGDTEYQVWEAVPIHICWDFNIGLGKPLSACLFQYIDDTFHFFDECVVHGQRTEDSLEEMAARGLLDFNSRYIVHGDATGRRRDTRSPRSDYDIIDNFLRNYKTPDGRSLRVTLDVPRDNPRIRDRHNMVNGVMRNAYGNVHLYVYQGCDILDKGFSLTHLKKGGQYLEDDSQEFQHITTAAGYGIWAVKQNQIQDLADSGGY